MSYNNNFTYIIKTSIHYLKTKENLNGKQSLRTLSYFLILKYIEPLLDDFIKINEFDFKLNDNSLLQFIRFSNLPSLIDDDILFNMNSLWNNILAIHPFTKQFFYLSKNFGISLPSTFSVIINKLSSFNFKHLNHDSLINLFEDAIKKSLSTKELGQYFTPLPIQNIMIELINPQVYNDGTFDSFYDPAMGCGGFLLTYYNFIFKKFNALNISPNIDFLINNIAGKEIDFDTYLIAITNLFIFTGHFFTFSEFGNSLTHPVNKQFDIILANPPYGGTPIKYDLISSPSKNEYLPIKSNSIVSLFIQNIIASLNNNGKACILLPTGKELFSKTQANLIHVRKHFLHTCNIHEIITLPPNLFRNTSIPTCIIFFTKGNFTRSIKFYEYDKVLTLKKFIIDVPADLLKSKFFSFSFTDYINNVSIVKQISGTEYLPFNNLFSFSSCPSNFSDNNGDYVFIDNSDNKTSSSFTLDGEFIFVSTKSLIIKYFNGKCSHSSVINYLVPLLPNLNLKFFYYYLKKIISNCSSSLISFLSNLTLPVPPIDVQNHIVSYIDNIYFNILPNLHVLNSSLNSFNKFIVNNSSLYSYLTFHKFGEVLTFLPKSKLKASFGNSSGKYPFFNCSLKVDHFVDVPDYTSECIIISSDIVPFIKISSNFSVSDHIYVLQSFNDSLYNLQYIYFYLFNNLHLIQNLLVGVGMPHLNKQSLCDINIPFPSIELQNKIINYCRYNDDFLLSSHNYSINLNAHVDIFIDNIFSFYNS